MSTLEPYLGIVKAVAIIGLILGLFGAGHHFGALGVQVKWDTANLEAEQKAARDALRKQNVIDAEAYRFAHKVAKDRVVTRTIIKEVEKYVQNSLPMLPGDFRLYHDAAAAGQEIDDSRRTDASPVAPKAVASTVGENYADCRYDKERLSTLQEIIRTINGGTNAEEKANPR